MRKSSISPDTIRRIFCYDPDTGSLTWNIRKQKIVFGAEVGCFSYSARGKLYRKVGISGVRILVHRVIWAWMTGAWPTAEIDHRDGDGCNNRWLNLREASHLQNGKNRAINKNHAFGINGVSIAKGGRFRARITVDRKEIHLGTFDTLAEAKSVRQKATQKYHGEFGWDQK